MWNTHNFAADRPQSPGGVSGDGEGHGGAGICTKAEGFRSCVTPKLEKRLGHSTDGPNCGKDTGFLTLDMFVLQERGATEGAPKAISQEAPQSAATELEGGAGAWPLPEGQFLLGPLFNPRTEGETEARGGG